MCVCVHVCVSGVCCVCECVCVSVCVCMHMPFLNYILIRIANVILELSLTIVVIKKFIHIIDFKYHHYHI